MIDIELFKRHAEDYLTLTETGRTMSERARDYVLGYQWTEAEEAKLKARGQAPIVVNRCHPKVEGLKGLLIQRQTDPKAYPRTQAHEEAAHAATDGLRYVADNTDFDSIKIDVADDYFVEGTAGAIVEIVQNGSEPEIVINRIPWDRIYYDPHSRALDFSDSRYFGVIVWMDREDAKAQFGDVVDSIGVSSMDGDTHEDRPRWVTGRNRERVRIAMEYTRHKGKWWVAYFSGDVFLIEPKESDYVDADGESACPIELVSAHIDRNNRRFGEAEYWLDLQDEINHRRSKALHLLSVRQTKSTRGAIADVPALKRELAKADGHVEINGEAGDFDVLPTGDMAQAQFALLEEAKAEIDAVGYNAQLSGERQGDLSGKAILALQGAGANEITSLFQRLNHWEKRIYRQIWARIRQSWTQQKWIRVTDDYKKLRWVGFNIPITMQEALEEKINDESLDEFTRKRAAQMYTAMMEAQDPRLQQQVMVKNPIAELDMDIKLEQSFDTVNVQQEQFEMMVNFAQARPEIPFTEVLKLSSFRNKEELIESLEQASQNAAQSAQAAMQAQQQMDAMKLQAEAQKEMLVQQQRLEYEERVKAAELELERQKAEVQARLKAQEQALKLQLEREKAMLQQTTARVTNETVRDQVVKIPEADMLTKAMDRLAQAKETDNAELRALIEAMQRPREVRRDQEGKVVALV